ncbi:hypothetical protein F4677DRAFT_426582 [Hypoxylon crocopeplum]|nr:hypothetical protein F4677DRAFT_426582 [Hypoxylon crocopeplum]
MFRLLRSRPNPYSLGARLYQSLNGPSPQVIQVHRVKIRRKWFKPRNLIFACCVYYFCYRVYKTSILDTIFAWSDNEKEELDEEEFFIPLPFTTRVIESQPYKGTDPEWQAFIRVNKDRELIRRIRYSLAELVRKTAQSSHMLVQRCGKDMELGVYWLNIQYPYSPPPIFVRKVLSVGSSVGDDSTTYTASITEEHVDTVTAMVIQRALWPSTLTLSMWSFWGALLKQNVLKFAKSLGYESNSVPKGTALDQTIEKLFPQIKKPAPKTDSKAPSSLPSANIQAADGSSTESTSPIEKRSAESSSPPGSATAPPSSSVSNPIPTTPDGESDKPKGLRFFSVIKHTQEHTRGPWHEFKQKFAQTWRPIREFPPRGAIHVSGLVEITTPRAVIIVDASAWWDPKTEQFDVQTTSFRLRNLHMKRQAPAR